MLKSLNELDFVLTSEYDIKVLLTEKNGKEGKWENKIEMLMISFQKKFEHSMFLDFFPLNLTYKSHYDKQPQIVKLLFLEKDNPYSLNKH